MLHIFDNAYYITLAEIYKKHNIIKLSVYV